MSLIKTDICIIGAGSGGLSVAAVATQLGMKTVLIEKAEMGGDCLNTGCVPSKALLAAAKRAYAHQDETITGIKAHKVEIDYAAVKDHVKQVIQTIEPHDSQERFEGLGVQVIREHARFLDRKTVQAGVHKIKARYFVIATGSRAFVPPIQGLEQDKILTNETIFDLRDHPEHLLIIGGGPIGLEMAQAHRRLGSEVSVVDLGEILPRDDQEHVAIVKQQLLAEGIKLYEKHEVLSVAHLENEAHLTIMSKGQEIVLSGSHLLAATGRVANIDKLDLEKAGLAFSQKGIDGDAHLKTSQSHIFAIGDVVGGPQFTHVAGYHAGIVIKHICFKMFWSKVDYKALPWVTYTSPEVAQVGLTEAEARKCYGASIKVVTWDFKENDRAIAERKIQGRVKVITDKKGYIIGASIIGEHAGELISMWGLAISNGLKIGAFTKMIAPYPTLGEINKRVAGAWYTPSLFSDKTKKIISWLQKLPF